MNWCSNQFPRIVREQHGHCEHCEHCEIGVVTLKNLREDLFESGDDKIFAITKVLNIIKIKYSVTKLKLINLPFV